MRESGHTLVELLVVVAILLAGFAVGLPSLKAASVEAHITGAADVFKGEFLRARTIATHNGVYTALRFERVEGGFVLSTYVDGNYNGVRDPSETCTITDANGLYILMPIVEQSNA